MTSRRQMLKWSAAAAAGALVSFPARFAQAEPTRLAIVVAQHSPLKALTRFELKKLYLGAHITDPSGERIVPFHQAASSPDRVAFEEKVLGMSPDEAASYWIDRKIRGQSGAPKAVGSAELVQRVVSKLEHSLAYVRLDQLRPEVRAIAIDGKPPTDAAYPLQLSRWLPSVAHLCDAPNRPSLRRSTRPG
ncbi:MAG TPA: twin-arginine translocation signal domain-containing protein [Polyangiaceae bacterium]|nr:twin-arginine translocation signal domain-containing protein [Polyangiaceae bacterium]